MSARGKKIFAFVLASAAFLPIVAAAQGIVPCNGSDCDFGSLVTLINNIINWFLTVSVSIAAVLFMFAGAKILLHPGDTGARADAKKIFKNVIIGLIIVLVAWLVVHTVVGAIVKTPNANRFLGN